MERTPEEQEQEHAEEPEETTHLPEGVEPETERKGDESGHSTDDLGDESDSGSHR